MPSSLDPEASRSVSSSSYTPSALPTAAGELQSDGCALRLLRAGLIVFQMHPKPETVVTGPGPAGRELAKSLGLVNVDA